MIAAWMLYVLVMSLGVGLAAWVIERMLLRTRVAIRWLWVGSIVLSLGLPAGALVVVRGVPDSDAGVATDQTDRASTTLGDRLVVVPVGMAVPRAWSALDKPLLALWIGLSMLMVVVLAWAGWRLRRDIDQSVPGRIAGTPVRVSNVVGPAAVGLGRPCVVVPDWVYSLDVESQRLIVTHELEHVRARDTWLTQLALTAVTLTPWNIVLWWQLRRLRGAIEVDCDTRVLSRGEDRHRYGTLLCEVSTHANRTQFSVAALTEPRSRLARRIEHMTRTNTGIRLPHVLASAAVLTLVVVISCEMPTPLSPAGPDTDSQGNVVLDASQVEVQPERLAGPAPRYPEMLRRAGIEGRVLLEFVIGTDGHVDTSSIRVAEATNRAFVAPARHVIANSVYKPAVVGDAPVAVRVNQSISFNIQRPGSPAVPDADVDLRADPPPDGEGPAAALQDVAEAVLGVSDPLIYIDGVRLGNPVYLDAIDPKDIERIEVFKGSASLADGAQTATGRSTVRILTRDKKQAR